MPCYMTGSAEGDARMAAREANEHATKMTDMLCRLLTLTENNHPRVINQLPRDIQRFWRQHKAVDAKRLKQEAQEAARKKLAQEALAKLTPEERKAINR